MAMPQGWETALLLILFWQGKNTVLAIVIFKHLINLEIYFTCLKSYNCQCLKPLWKFWVTLYKNPHVSVLIVTFPFTQILPSLRIPLFLETD